MSLKKKAANRRRSREVRRAIRVLHASSLEGALWEALRFRCEQPEWLDRPMHGGSVVAAQYFQPWTTPQPKRGDLTGGRYFVDMGDKYNRATVALLRVAPPDVISNLGYYLHAGELIYGASRFTLASTKGFETFETSRQGDGWVHHTVRENARLWRDACRRAGGHARFSVTDQAYDSDHQVGVVPHGHDLALMSDNGEELYPKWHVA